MKNNELSPFLKYHFPKPLVSCKVILSGDPDLNGAGPCYQYPQEVIKAITEIIERDQCTVNAAINRLERKGK